MEKPKPKVGDDYVGVKQGDGPKDYRLSVAEVICQQYASQPETLKRLLLGLAEE